MTAPDEHTALEPADEDTRFDGYTLDRLSDYLDSDMTPPDPGIDASPVCQMALASLRSIRIAAAAMLQIEADREAPPDSAWITRVLGVIRLNAHPGRTISIPYPDPAVQLTTTEGAIRGLIRSAGDHTRGVLIGRCTLEGDLDSPDAPIRVHADAAVYWGENIKDTATRLQHAIATALAEQTHLNVTEIDITVHDIHLPPAPQELEGGR